ncbi:unnamed protein product [Brassicogethes aeneus]|uniref:Uncharacterized protein n=1 Tax=Brassicogethes aeneus TaxID=1431903 RepID=A0A9P0BFH1_BRAAE|nr:unnamed protein product [Brassicogethes aeneus]
MSFKAYRRLFGTVRRKYPINRDQEKSLPIFQYGVSNESYQRLYAWGNIQTGALGIPFIRQNESVDKVSCLRHPKRVTFGEKHNVTAVACGYGFTVFGVENDEHKLFGSGLNTDSQIGHHEINEGKPLSILFYPKPIHLSLKNSTSKILKLSAGRAHCMALTDEGVYLQGNNSYGQCGRKILENEDYLASSYVNHIPNVDGKKICDVQCGQDHSLLLTEDGAVYSCGWGADGQTGQGHYNNLEVFTQVGGDIANEKIIELSCRADFVLARNDKGEVFGWGNTEYSQLGPDIEEQQVCNPTYIKSLKSFGKITSIASGGSFCLILNENGDVFSWGFGILGMGPSVEHSKVPLPIPKTLFGKNDFQPSSEVVKVACGTSHSAAITNSGDLYTWGRNSNACLGLGHDKDQYFPFKVSMGASVTQVFCGVDHTVVLSKPFI